ncbi:hypothetical protein [Paenibacillus sinopodophylli]|uniref:hypothetical protein n=1 Tax=Paenibacillus sinopodophylli TaxID=1837342 RepID=UPI00110CC417|nr:hypothetical protein [Paenibacillus sinopodophylli]
MNLSLQFNPARKPSKRPRTKPTQRQLGAISAQVDKDLKERSNGMCEVREHCQGVMATERAHTTGRRIIPHKTTVDDLFHACKHCHIWLDEQPEGIRFKRTVRKIGTTAYLRGLRHAEAP